MPGGPAARAGRALGCRLSAARSPQNIAGQGCWGQRGSRESRRGACHSAEAASHSAPRGTPGGSPQASRAPSSAGPNLEGLRGKGQGVSLAPGGGPSPGSLVFLAEGTGGRGDSPPRGWARGAQCGGPGLHGTAAGRQPWLGAGQPRSEQSLPLWGVPGGMRCGQAVLWGAVQRAARPRESGAAAGGACGGDAGARQRALSRSRTFQA